MLSIPSVSDISAGTISREDFQAFLRVIQPQLHLLDEKSLIELNDTLAEIERLDSIERARVDFISFVRRVCKIPGGFKFSSRGQHHRLAKAFEALVDGDLKRLTVSMPPRFGKSELGSILLVAWTIGKNPDWKILQASANTGLVKKFGRSVKNVINSEAYQEIFPGIKISRDASAANKFTIEGHQGEYNAVGIDSGVAGIGGDLIVCDDIVNEQDAKTGKPEAFESAWTWYQSGPLQRLQPGGRILMIATRWSKADPIGRVKRRMKEDPEHADQYVSIEIPALDEKEQSTFPELWPTDDLQKKRSNMSPILWNAQYQQNPTAVENSIIPIVHWRKWEKFKRVAGTLDEVDYLLPDCTFILMVWDTAFTKNKRSNPSACTIWGVFEYRDPDTGIECNHLILLHTFKRKMSTGELKVESKRLIGEWSPDCICIEDGSSGGGTWLRNELMEAGIYTEGVRPKGKEDKVSRLNSVSDVFRSMVVWYVPTSANEGAVQEVADFPNGDEDDITDTVAYGVRRFRQGGFIRTSNDAARDTEDREHISREYY